jgi:hypothetical protein
MNALNPAHEIPIEMDAIQACIEADQYKNTPRRTTVPGVEFSKN